MIYHFAPLIVQFRKSEKSKDFRSNFSKSCIQQSGDLGWIPQVIFSLRSSHLVYEGDGKGIICEFGTLNDIYNNFRWYLGFFHELQYKNHTWKSVTFIRSSANGIFIMRSLNLLPRQMTHLFATQTLQLYIPCASS